MCLPSSQQYPNLSGSQGEADSCCPILCQHLPCWQEGSNHLCCLCIVRTVSRCVPYHCGLQGANVKKPYNPVLGEVFKCYYELPEVMQVDREMDQTRTVRDCCDRHTTAH